MTEPRGPRLVPAYLATGGRTGPDIEGLDRLTVLLRAEGVDQASQVSSLHRRLCSLLEPGALTLLECAAHLELPVSVTRVLVADLIEEELVRTREPASGAGHFDRPLLERLLSGLRTIDC